MDKDAYIHYDASESVTEGHPDKICDQISDAILDAVLKEDPDGACCCETNVTFHPEKEPNGIVIVSGEITTKAKLDVEKIVRETLRDIGYTRRELGIDCEKCTVINYIHEQSREIAKAEKPEDDDMAQGAGDQGIMFGYACKETGELMPLPITLSHQLAKRLADVRKEGILKYLRPDGKSKVVVKYDRDKKAIGLKSVTIAAQHNPDVEYDTLRADIIEHVIRPVCKGLLSDETVYIVNGLGGSFVTGGPEADTGLTGRKITVDTYGGRSCHGGGAFSGKVPNKQDRSGAYMARYIAKNVVAAGLADECEVQISYTIGCPEPDSISLTKYIGKYDEATVVEAIKKVFDMTPAGTIKNLDLKRPIYKKTACYGHFGRPEFPWEKTDKVEELKKAVG